MEDNLKRKLIEAGGNLWEKHGKYRVYFNSDFVAEIGGLDVGRYKTGNISSATLHGEKISNSEARRIYGDLSAAKFFVDDDGLHITGIGKNTGSTSEVIDTFTDWVNHILAA